jgi:3-deoxy-manno-octulosonate cytidylyltransferase (CMP-KDO synthetase)
MKTAFKVVIPARYASTRLPGKPLREIAGQPMIAHVCQRAKEAEANQIVVATDSEEIFEVVNSLGFEVMMTSVKHQSGTERIAEVAERLGWEDDEIIVNLQGDEPLIAPDYIRNVAHCLARQNQAGIATLAAKISDVDEIFNPNHVKVVLDQHGYALYFSRAPIPWERDVFPHDKPCSNMHLRHIGLYAYTVGFVKSYITWPVSLLESIEALEQLRILWHGEKIRVDIVDNPPEAGVDTEEDLIRVAHYLGHS